MRYRLHDLETFGTQLRDGGEMKTHLLTSICMPGARLRSQSGIESGSAITSGPP